MSSPMSPSDRAEARRKAILSRGSDRLKKLTSSARGEDAPQFNEPPPTRGDRFSREGSGSPTPSLRSSPSPSESPYVRQRTPSNLGQPDPSIWPEEQKQQFLQALMGGMSDMNQPSPADTPRLMTSDDDPPVPSMDDNPLASMFQQLGMPPPPLGPHAPADLPSMKPKLPPTRLQRLLPLLHLIGVWCLLAYFVIYAEPDAQEKVSGMNATEAAETRWFRWADLAHRKPEMETDSIGLSGWFVQIVPFFWAFTTLQIAAHSMRIFSGFDSVEPPSLVAFALPHLPAPIPSIIINGLKYLQMLNLFMDDLATLLFGVGFVVVLANYLTGGVYV